MEYCEIRVNGEPAGAEATVEGEYRFWYEAVLVGERGGVLGRSPTWGMVHEGPDPRPAYRAELVEQLREIGFEPRPGEGRAPSRFQRPA